MSRIERALEKLRGREPAAAPVEHLAPAPQRPSPTVAPVVPHAYGGKAIGVDIDRLRGAGMLPPEAHERAIADQYRVIKRVLLKNAAPHRDPAVDRGNLIMVTSALPAEGKTFTCINLCLSLARDGDWSVVLIDADCQKNHLSELFGVGGQLGLTEWLKDTTLDFDALVMPTDVERLSVVSAGRRHQDSVELLASSRMEALCSRLASEDRRRLIVFDTSPLLATAEAAVLSSHVGQVVVVVGANATPQQSVITALERLDQSKAINLILNNAIDDGASNYSYYEYGNPLTPDT